MKPLAPLALLAAMCVTPIALASSVTFEMIPGALSANDMSPDGRYIVGVLTSGRGYILDTVLNQTIELPPNPTPGGVFDVVAVSDNGQVVLGNMVSPGRPGAEAHRWTAASGVWTTLGSNPTAVSGCGSFSSGYELSGDGNVAVGLEWFDGCHAAGFRWTPDTGMQMLEFMANGVNRASVVNSQGNVIGGFGQGSFDRTPVMWGSNLEGELLDPPHGDAVGEVLGMNRSGSILLGNWNGKAVKWSNGGAVRTQIGNGTALPGWLGNAMDMANNGTIVGFDTLIGNRRAWILPPGATTMVDLKNYVVANGGTVPAGTILEVAQAVSNNGSIIIGHSAFLGAWMIRQTPTNLCAADFAPAGGDGVVDGTDLGVLLGNWGTPFCDLTDDGTTDGSDLGVLLGSWGACPEALGACCTANGCSVKTPSQCAAANGVFLGVDYPCTGNVCVSNDLCAQAVDITSYINLGEPYYGDNSTATPGKYQGADPELPLGSPSCHWNGQPQTAHSSVWFRFTCPPAGKITVSVCNTLPAPFVDSIITMYEGECGELTEIGCDEDGCGQDYPFYSRLTVENLTPGQTYLICVMNSGDWGGSTPGPFDLAISTPGGIGGP
ncbi:MAG: hypothetical protein U0636_06620 [Phycisphaerales bacterium]